LIAGTHWATSVAPGILTWIALAVVELAASGGRSGALLASGTCASMIVVSTIPWALTVTLPRFSGAIGWLLLLTLARMTFGMRVPGAWTMDSTRLGSLVEAAGVFLLFPIVALGQPLSRVQLIAIVPAVALACGALASALNRAAHADVPLEAAQ
jgi:hypothetical protein